MKKNVLFIVLLSFLTTGIAHATITTYTDQAAFLAATGGLSQSTLDFESLPVGALPNGTEVDGITLSNDSGWDMIVDNYYDTTSAENYLGLDDGVDYAFMLGDSLDMAFTSAVQAVGLYIIGDFEAFWADDFTLHAAGELVNLTLASPVGLPDGGEAFFLGIYQDDINQSFSNASLSSAYANGVFFNIDDITTASTDPIPEPGTLLLMGTGLAGLIFGKRRKK